MATKRCRKGSRKCFSGKCVKKSSRVGVKRCRKGTKKCADRKCHSKTRRNKSTVKSDYNLRSKKNI